MGTGAFRTDQIVEIEGVPLRMYRMVSGSRWQLEHQKTLCIQEFENDQLLKMYLDKKLTFPATIDPQRRISALSEMSEEVSEIAKIRRMYVVATLKTPNSRARLEPVIQEVWNHCHLPAKRPSYSSVIRWKTRYLEQGEDYRVLVNNDKAKGNRTGRFDAKVVELSKEAVNQAYMTLERKNIQSTLQHALHKFRIENEKWPKGFKFKKAPTRRLIKRLIEEIPAYHRHVARYGLTSARREFRSVQGRTIAEAPLERAEIDHTELDLIVLDDRTGEPIGRPWLTVCIDVYSRCVLGIYIGFIPPSENSVIKCLKDCLQPKISLRVEHPEIHNEWSAFGKMHHLVVDNGLEFHSTNLQNVCYSMNIGITYSPRKEPWFKGCVERFFGTLNGLIHTIPGTTFSNTTERGEYESERRACVTLSTLRMIVRKWIADLYHQSVNRGIQTTPEKLWKSWVSSNQLTAIELPDVSVDLDFMMAKSKTRKLTHRGIQNESLWYNSPELEHLRHKYGESTEVKIRVDEDDLGHIYVVDPGSHQHFLVPAIDLEYANGISLHQHEEYRKLQRARSKEGYDEGDLLDRKAEIERIIREDSARNRKLRTQKRLARHREESELAQAKAKLRGHENTQRSAFVPAADRTDSSACEQKFPPQTAGEPIQSVSPAPFKALYKEGY